MSINCGVNSNLPVLQFIHVSSQNVISENSIIPFDDTIPQQTEGFEVITVDIIPKFSTSTLEIEFFGWANIPKEGCAVALFRDNEIDSLNAINFNLVEGEIAILLKHFVKSNTIDNTKFKIRCGVNSGSNYITFNGSPTRKFGGVSNIQLQVKEYF